VLIYSWYVVWPVQHFFIKKCLLLLACYGLLGCFSLHFSFELAVLHFYLYSLYLFLYFLFLGLFPIVP
jgi:hypothetical protein